MCGVCGKRFGQATNLERHSRKHQCAPAGSAGGSAEGTPSPAPAAPVVQIAEDSAGGDAASGPVTGCSEHTPESEWPEVDDGASDEELLDASSNDVPDGADADFIRERDSLWSPEDEL